jgi:6-phosphogluconolactonase
MSVSSVLGAESAHTFFLGTYTRDGSKGIYSSHLEAKTGALTVPQLAAELGNPTFLALHPNGKIVYAIGDFVKDGKVVGGAVSAYAMNSATGGLALINQEPSGGGGLTHLAVDATGRMLIAVSYGSGYVVSFPLQKDGRIGTRATFLPEEGPLGPNTSRQDKSHAHSVTISPDNRFAFVANLAFDRVFSYRIDPATATFQPNDPAFITIAPGAGPRHTKFSADGKSFYVLNEIVGMVTVCSYDAATGQASPIQEINTLPADFARKDPDRAAEIRVHPNGKFVYASNRGHDSIAVFARDTATGKLTLVEFAPCGGKEPRNFSLSPDGAWLVCAHQNSNSLVSFKVDPTTGRLTPAGSKVETPVPVCVLFAN